MWHSFRGNKREAQIERAKIITEAQGGGAIDPKRITVAEYIDQFLREKALHVTAASLERYQYSLEHVRQHLGGRLLQKLRSDEVGAMYAALILQGLSPRTVRLVHAVLCDMLSHACKQKPPLLRDNVAVVVRPPAVVEHEVAILQPEQARELLDRLRGHPLYLFASLALGTGMRRNEILGLRWSDIDLETGQLTVNQALEQTTAHGVRTKSPKTKRGRRTISMPASLVADLRSQRRVQQEQWLAVGVGRLSDKALVFATAGGRALTPHAISKAWARALAAHGLPHVQIHALRHSHASHLLGAGVDLLTVSRRLGHSKPAITLNVYGHLLHGNDQQAARIIDAALGGGKR